MHSAELLNYAAKALYLSLVLSLPAIVAAAVVGTIIAVVQALTQIQEQTLSYVAKLVVTVAAIAVTAQWTGVEIVQYTRQVFDLVPYIRR